MKSLLILAATAMLTLFATTILAQPVAVLVFEADNGTRYAVSPGTATGTCESIPGGKWCHDGGHESSVTHATGCGTVRGQGFCFVIPENWAPPINVPLGTTTLECEDKNYELSDGGSGECNTENNGTAEGSGGCSQQNTSNFANADCENGCGTVSGTGSCTVKAKP